MIITITDIKHFEELGDVFSFCKMKIKGYTYVRYTIDFSDNQEVEGFIRLEGKLNEKEIKENIKIRHNIMETEFISLGKKEKGKTTFTYILNSDTGWGKVEDAPDFYDKVVYLGNCKYDGDMFACYKDNTIDICKGVVGSEFK